MKKKVWIFFIFLIMIAIAVCFLFLPKTQKEAKSDNVYEFEISKIKYYSSANAISNTTNYQNPEWNITIYQYTDIAIYLDRINAPKPENYIAKLAFRLTSSLPEDTAIYYLNPQNFGNSNLSLDDKIAEELNYSVINSSNRENSQNYNIPIFFQDCSNPITMRIVNTFPNHYKVSKDSTLVYNGSLLKNIGIEPNTLNRNFQFELEMETKQGTPKTIPIELEIPLEDETRSILDGDFEQEVKQNWKF